jgi:hypothetical protein
MKNRYVGIDKFVGLDGTTTYFVMEVNDNKSKIVYRSSSKNGAYQVAHKYARLNVIPLYETIYNALVDDNGVTHLHPVKQNKIVA